MMAENQTLKVENIQGRNSVHWNEMKFILKSKKLKPYEQGVHEDGVKKKLIP